MGVIVQSLFSTTIVGSYTTTDTAFTLTDAVENSTGFATLNQGGANQEMIYWGGKSGNQVTSCLRGLSLTALTVTEVTGNKKNHVDSEAFAIDSNHYIINDKASKTSDETIANEWTFSKSPVCSEAADSANELMRYNETVRTTGVQTIADKKTFSSVPDTTAGDPVADNDLVRKAYADSLGAIQNRSQKVYFGEAAAQNEAVSIEDQTNVEGGSDADFGRDATSQGVFQAQSFVAGNVPTAFSMTVSLQKVGAPTDNAIIEIQTDNAGSPSGTVVTNGTSNTVAGTGLGLTYSDESFTWASVPVLVAGDKHWIVLKRDGANSDTNYYQVEFSSVVAFRSGQMKKYTTSWTTNVGNDDDMVFAITGVDGVAVLANIDTYNYYRGQKNFYGFAFEAAAIGELKLVTTNGVVEGLSGLVGGTKYYISSTDGQLAVLQSFFEIGMAINSTDFLIRKTRKMIETPTAGDDEGKGILLNSSEKIETDFIDTGTGANQIVQRDGSGNYPSGDGSAIVVTTTKSSGVATRTAAVGSGTQTITTGFRPALVEIRAIAFGSGDFSDSFGSSDGTVHQCIGSSYDTGGSVEGAYVSTTKAIKLLSDGGTPSADWEATITITATGFEINWTEGAFNTSEAKVHWKALK